MRFRRLSLIAALAALAAGSAAAQTGGTLAKLRASQSATMGVRDSSAPLSYSLGGSNYTGYHVELCERILRELVPGIRITYMPVTSANRVLLVKNGTVDLECGSTTNTDARQRDAAFALTTFIAEIRMAVKQSSGIQSIEQLAGKRVVTTTGGTGVTLLRKHERARNVQFDLVQGRDNADGFVILEGGRADAFVLDDNVLAGLIALSSAPQDYAIVGETLSVDPNAIMLRKDDPQFKAAVDAILRRMMASGELEQLYTKWFMRPIPPRNVTVNLPMGRALRQAFAEPNDRSADETNR